METTCPDCGHRYDPEAAPRLKGACPKCMMDALRDETMLMDTDAINGGLSSTDSPLNRGDTFCGMKIVDLLGRGGMGFVYKARQPKLDRTVALKILDPKLADSPEFATRFNREAKALATLNHPNIVQVYDFGQQDDHHYLVMEFIDGTTLRQIMVTQRMAPETALRYVPQICDALEYAHSQGVIHRDIKPENILIDPHGNLKIADFGLAKMTLKGSYDGSQLTMTGQAMGTPNYMAPEQRKEMATVDHRADIYSLGVVFYEMLTGELPIGRFPVPSESIHVDVSLDEVVLKALESDPDRRYQHASQIKVDISSSNVRGHKEVVGTPPPSGRRLSLLAVCGALGFPMALVSSMLFRPLLKELDWSLSNIEAFSTTLGGAVVLLGIILSVVGWSAIRNSNGRLYGRGAAWFGIGFPLLMIILMLVWDSIPQESPHHMLDMERAPQFMDSKGGSKSSTTPDRHENWLIGEWILDRERSLKSVKAAVSDLTSDASIASKMIETFKGTTLTISPDLLVVSQHGSRESVKYEVIDYKDNGQLSLRYDDGSVQRFGMDGNRMWATGMMESTSTMKSKNAKLYFQRKKENWLIGEWVMDRELTLKRIDATLASPEVKRDVPKAGVEIDDDAPEPVHPADSILQTYTGATLTVHEDRFVLTKSGSSVPRKYTVVDFKDNGDLVLELEDGRNLTVGMEGDKMWQEATVMSSRKVQLYFDRKK